MSGSEAPACGGNALVGGDGSGRFHPRLTFSRGYSSALREGGAGLFCYSLLFDLSHGTLVLGSAEEADVRILSHCGGGGGLSSHAGSTACCPPQGCVSFWGSLLHWGVSLG